VIRATPEVRKLSSKTLRQFSVDVVLIALAVRTAYLVDVILVVKDHVKFFSQLIQRLRQEIPAFEDVTLWHDTSSAQSFILNTSLFKQTYRDLQRNYQSNPESTWTTFVRLDDKPILLVQTPAAILQALEVIHIRTSDNPISVTGPQGLTQELMIPIASILLEYPVAYVPVSSDQTIFLSMEVLNVYDCCLMHAEIGPPKKHTFLKFSCPVSIGVGNLLLSPQNLVDRMKGRFIPRLQKADGCMTMDVHVSTEKLDRVAL